MTRTDRHLKVSMIRMLVLTILTFGLFTSTDSYAQKPKHLRSLPANKYVPPKNSTQKPTGKATTTSRPGEVTLPVNVGIGPAAFTLTGPVADDQFFHPGLRIDVFAVISPELIRQNINRVPKKYRKQALGIKSELRYSPLWYLPESLILAPAFNNTGIFGVNFNPLSLSIPLSESPRLSLSAGLLLSYAYIASDTLPSPTHFLRPGLGLKAEAEFPLSKSFLVSLGWQSSLYPPQEVGGAILEWGELDTSIWHIGQAFLLFHFRFPYTTTL